MSKLSIIESIRTILLSDSELNNYVNNRIYPVYALDETGDYIICGRDKYGKDYTKFGQYSDFCTIIIVIASTSYSRSVEIAEIVSDKLEGFHVYENSKYEARLVDSTEDSGNLKYLQILAFDIK